MQTVNQAAGKLQDHHHQSQAILQQGHYSPTPEMAIIHRTMHDAIHAIREQRGRAVTRSLLNQQRTLAASKLQCNMQIMRTSTRDPPSMSNVPPT